MADLSAVLRKTIDGLPQATPQLRAKVYEKARGAIARQIDTASPPLPDEVAATRRTALEEAIERTESYYAAVESLEEDPGTDGAAPAAMTPRPPAPQPSAAGMGASAGPASSPAAPSSQAAPQGDAGIARPAWRKATAPAVLPEDRLADAPPVPARSASARRPSEPAPTDRRDRDPREGVPDPAADDRRPSADRFAPDPSADAGGSDRRVPGRAAELASGGLYGPQPIGETEPRSGFDVSDLAPADFGAARFSDMERIDGPRRSRAPVVAGLAALLLLGGGGALAYLYRDDIQAMLKSPEGGATETALATPSTTAVPVVPNAAPAPAASPPADAPAASPAPAAGVDTPASADGDASPEGEIAVPPAAKDNTENTDTDVAALSPPPTAPAAIDTAPAASEKPAAGRRFTQRLLPDGSEVDAGPGAGSVNAFEEGTNVAAASPELSPAAAPGASAVAGALPAGSSATGAGADGEAAVPASGEPAATPAATSQVAGAASPPAPVPSTGPAAPTVTAALPPEETAKVPLVSQKAVFYEERSETEQGTQQGGNVVWSVVNEPPSEGQPAEPAIRGVVTVPDEKIRMTMTIRRNGDATLPASHVIELMFDVPPGFPGGQIANVQRLALKSTEQARGEPLIGVAGKISDGFFIIALNNLTQATETNLDLLAKQQWIDIPLAYATGRRALMSVEKGIPGDRVFKQAMDAWAAKT